MNSQINNKTAYNDFDEDDLELDLGEIENEALSRTVQSKVKQASENLFKKPADPLSSNENNANKTTLDNSILSTLIEEDAQAPIQSKPKSHQEDLDILSQLFEKDDEDEEDDQMQEFFKNESVFMSTQKVISSKSSNSNTSLPKTQEKIEPPKLVSQPVIQKVNEPVKKPEPKQNQPQQPAKTISHYNQQQKESQNQSVIVEKESNRTRTVSNETDLSTRSSKEILSALKENKMWTTARNDLELKFRNIKLDTQSIHNYNIQYYFKRFFEKDLLIKNDLSKNNIRKLPILCAWIKEVSRKTNQATVILNDGSADEISGTIPNSILAEYWSYFMIGSVLILQDVCLIRVNYSKNCYHLNIKIDNLLAIYYLNLEGTITDNEVAKREIKQLEPNKIKELIDKFEEVYTNYDYLSYLANTTVNNTTTTNSSINTSSNKSKTSDQSTYKRKSNSMSNLHNNKPAPYQVPNRPTQAQQFAKPKTPMPPPSASTSQRSFNFNKPTNASKPAEQTQINLTLNCSQLNTTNALSQEALSQLIFGIEDQLFDEE